MYRKLRNNYIIMKKINTFAVCLQSDKAFLFFIENSVYKVMLFYVDVEYPHQVLNKYQVPGQLITTSHLFRIARNRTCKLVDFYFFIFFFISHDVLRSVRARVPLRSANVSSVARNLWIHERHRRRGTDPGGERTGETGEDVLQTGRV